MKTKWLKICANLQKRLNSGTYKVWVEPLTASFKDNILYLTAVNEFVASWVRERLLVEIQVAALEALDEHLEVQVLVDETGSVAQRSAPVVYTEQLTLPITLAKPSPKPKAWRYDFDSFVVGPTNDLAYAAAKNMTRETAGVDTLFLSSGPGLGKTHLTQAVGAALYQACNRTNPTIEYLTAEEFSTCFVQAIRAKDMDGFKNRFRDIDVLLLEDVHFLQGKEKMQDEVLSTIKTLQAKGSRVVLTSSFAPRELHNVDSSLVSRFCSGFLAGIEKPDASTRLRIISSKAQSQNYVMPEPVADLLASNLTGDIRQLEGCLHNLLLRAKLSGEAISISMAQEILSQYFQGDNCVNLDSIIRKICQGYALTPDNLASKSRKQDLVLARNMIFYLARRHTDLSLQDIGQKFNRQHSTVLKGIASIERELSRETPLSKQISNTIRVVECKN